MYESFYLMSVYALTLDACTRIRAFKFSRVLMYMADVNMTKKDVFCFVFF